MNRLALFSSFIPPKSKKLPRYILIYLKQIRKHVQTLVYLYNDDFPLSHDCHKQLSEIVNDIMPVKNEGYDFGMWQKGLRKHAIQHYDELLLLNDSCVCIGSFDDYFKWHDSTEPNVTALTRSEEFVVHLQSYFMCIKKPVVHIAANWILNQNFTSPQITYTDIVVAGEFGLSTILRLKRGVITSFIQPIGQINISMHFPKELVESNSPLIKKKALTKNTFRILHELSQKGEQPSNNSAFLTEVIRKHHNFSSEHCHELFDWMEYYVIEDKIHRGSCFGG